MKYDLINKDTGKPFTLDQMTLTTNATALCPNRTDIQKCLEEYSFEIDEVFEMVLRSGTNPKAENLSTVFEKGPLDIIYGTYFKLQIPWEIGTSFFSSPILFVKEHVLENLSPSAVFHNHGQLRHSLDEFHLPQLSIPLSLVRGQLRVLAIELVEHVNLNLKRSPCVKDPTYDLGLCLDQYLSRHVGCKLPWGKKSSQIPEQDCETADEFTHLKGDSMSETLHLSVIQSGKFSPNHAKNLVSPFSQRHYSDLQTNYNY
eukprot:TCALIF_11886-PA protein Name:"Protein of unknown function" AED:0.15 eAED:0.55 QI:20/0.5/0/1/0.5/0/3/0/257